VDALDDFLDFGVDFGDVLVVGLLVFHVFRADVRVLVQEVGQFDFLLPVLLNQFRNFVPVLRSLHHLQFVARNLV